MKLKKRKLLVFGIDYKVMLALVFGENMNEAEHNGKAKIDEGDKEELKDMMEQKEKKPLVFGIDYKVLKILVFGENKIKAEHTVIDYNGNVDYNIKNKTTFRNNNKKAVKGKIRAEKKLPDETVFDANKEKVGKAEESEKVNNLERKIREEKKTPEEKVFNANKEKVSKAEEFEGKQRQNFGTLDYSAKTNAKVQKELQVLNETGNMTASFFKIKVWIFADNKIEAELDGVDCNVLKMLVLGKNKIKAEYNVIEAEMKNA